jgi:hypothetical protein
MQRLRSVYDEWARGEYWSVDIYDPEIVFVLGDSLPEPGTYQGLEGLERGLSRLAGELADLRFDLDELIPAGEAIVAMYHQSGTGRASGVHTELDGGHVWRMPPWKPPNCGVQRRESSSARGPLR